MSPRSQRELSKYEFQMARWDAETVTCPRCGALGRTDLPPKDDGTEPDGETCRNPLTGDKVGFPAHFQRIDAAKETHHP